MNNEHIYSKYTEALTIRSQQPSLRLHEHSSGDYMLAHLQSLVFHMINEVPGCAEYVKRETDLLEELNATEGIVSWLEVPAESL